MSRRPSLRPLFDEYNRTYWGGRLPHYRVQRRRMFLWQGLTRRPRRIIWINAAITDPLRLKRVLLHEMCHVAANTDEELSGHGPLFKQEMARLASAGESWAREEAESYHERGVFRFTWSVIREDYLQPLAWEPRPSWRRARLVAAHVSGMSVREFDRRYPGAKRSWAALLRQRTREEKSEERTARLIQTERC